MIAKWDLTVINTAPVIQTINNLPGPRRLLHFLPRNLVPQAVFHRDIDRGAAKPLQLRQEEKTFGLQRSTAVMLNSLDVEQKSLI